MTGVEGSALEEKMTHPTYHSVTDYEAAISTQKTGNSLTPAALSRAQLLVLLGVILSFGVCGAWWTLMPVFIKSGAASALGLDDTAFASAASLTFMAMGFSSPAWGKASDSWGRQLPMLCALSVGVCAATVEASSKDGASFMLARVLAGIGVSGIQQTSLPYLVETCPMEKRGAFNTLAQASFSLVGQSLLALISMHIARWRVLSAIAVIPALLAIATVCLLPDSPQHLASKGKHDSAAAASEVYFGRTEPDPATSTTAEQSSSILATLRPSLRFQTLALIYCWCGAVVLYFSMSYDNGLLKGRLPALSNLLLGIVDLPAYILTARLVERPNFGRVGSQIIFFTAAGVAHFIIMIPNICSSAMILAGLMARFSATAAFTTIWMLATETFPANVRSSGIGICNFHARTAGFASPLLSLLPQNVENLITALYALSAAAATYAALEETRDKSLALFMKEDLSTRERGRAVSDSLANQSCEEERTAYCSGQRTDCRK